MSVFLNGSIKTDHGFVTRSAITDSSIDMNIKKITSLQDPTEDLDAVNLRTLLSHTTNISFIDITLIDTFPTVISDELRGAFIITVTGLTEGFPCATFHVCKTLKSTELQNISRIESSTTSSGERLYLTWLANDKIKLYKDGTSSNGLYRIKLI